MGVSEGFKQLVSVEVTPRFEVFYALQALQSGTGERLAEWRRDMERGLPARIRTEIVSVAPSPLMWPLLADALRDEPADIAFPEMIAALHRMDLQSFQRCVLAGVFKGPRAVEGLMSGRSSLKRTVANEPKTQEKLLALLGLRPFEPDSAASHVFEQIVSNPAPYRDEVVSVLESFWNNGFRESWSALEPELRNSAREIRRVVLRNGLRSFAAERQLPITLDKGAILSVRGTTRVTLKATLGVHLIPSAFNVGKLWAAYRDSDNRTRFFVPILEPGLIEGPARREESRTPIVPSTVFKALGDTTRYAIATTLARTPMTSVELARVFEVSKPTISHHVQQLRAAHLLREEQSENGVVLSLDRRVLEKASSAAANEMFSDEGPEHVVKRSRRANSEKNYHKRSNI
jgi:DNA-binding transcriptional ArsR family regulator